MPCSYCVWANSSFGRFSDVIVDSVERGFDSVTWIVPFPKAGARFLLSLKNINENPIKASIVMKITTKNVLDLSKVCNPDYLTRIPVTHLQG